MAEVLSQVQIQASSKTPVDANHDDSTHVRDGLPKSGESNEARLTQHGRTNSNRLIRNISKDAPAQSTDGRKEQQGGIDPLSQVWSPTVVRSADPLTASAEQQILRRTHTSNFLPAQQQKTRPGMLPEESAAPELVGSIRTSSEPSLLTADTPSSAVKDKRKGVSFLSRFIGSKKKDAQLDINDDESEVGDKRTEGTNADVFSHPVGSSGFIPRFPAPPKYIKVRCHGKKERDFNRVFLAQELRGRSGVEIAQAGGRQVKAEAYKCGDPKKDGNAVWAMEFSKDGRYLAAGGQDYVVRIWAVISNTDDRRAHENEEDTAGKEEDRVRLNAPVFKSKTIQEYGGHTGSVLDLSWSKNNFLLSSSMDKTVRLWHVSRSECLCCFKHSDFVTSIQFHPRDDRFFLAGSLDSKLRLWSIPDKSVAFWNQLPELITAVAFSPDGKTAIAGLLNGLCLVYETEGLKPQTQIHVKSTHGKNAKGSKITGIQTINFPPEDPNGEVKVLITSNDSRVRVYNLRDKALEIKLKGNQNSCSQIHASFSDDARYVICGSEDRKAYIWSTGPPETEKDRRPVEMFEAHSAIVTNAIMAPIKTKQLLGGSADPLYDLCNPPAVTLVSRSESHSSSRPPTENGNVDGSFPPTPAITTSEFEKPSKPEESQAYITRSAHPDGNVIVTADYMGHIKVFRQDCAYQKRLRNDANFSRKMLGRTNSVATRSSRRSKRDSFVSTPNPSSDRILSWRQSIANSSNDNVRRTHPRSTSPRKPSLQSPGHTAGSHSSPAIHNTPSVSTTSPSRSLHRSSNDDSKIYTSDPPYPALNPDTNPLMLQGDHSYMFWSKSAYQNQAQAATHNHLAHQQNVARSARSSVASSRGEETDRLDPMMLGVPVGREMSQISALSSDESEVEEEGAEEMTCRRCGGQSFRARGGGKVLSCGSCGEIV